MSYALPRFAWLHATSDAVAGSGALTCSVSIDAAFPLVNLADRVGNTLARLASAQTTFHVDVDRGSASLEAIDALLIPAGHNLGGTTLDVDTSTTGVFGGEQTARVNAFAVPAGDAVIDLSGAVWITAATQDRYLRLTVAGSSAVYEFGELWYTHVRQADRRSWAPDYSDLKTPSGTEQETATGVAFVAFSAPRATIEGTFEKLYGNDLSLFDELLAFSLTRLPLVYWRPASDAVPIFVRAAVSKRAQSSPAPAGTGEWWSFDLALREAV